MEKICGYSPGVNSTGGEQSVLYPDVFHTAETVWAPKN